MHNDPRLLFADTPGLAWHQRAGLEVLLDALANRDAEQAERVAMNLYRQAAFAEARAEGRAR